jgi:hypothetical protein
MEENLIIVFLIKKIKIDYFLVGFFAPQCKADEIFFNCRVVCNQIAQKIRVRPAGLPVRLNERRIFAQLAATLGFLRLGKGHETAGPEFPICDK